MVLAKKKVKVAAAAEVTETTKVPDKEVKKTHQADDISEAEINRMLEKAKELVTECQNLEQKTKKVEGWTKFCRLCTLEQMAQEKRLAARKSGETVEAGAGKVAHYSRIVEIVRAHAVNSVLQNISFGSYGRIRIDAVAVVNERPVWIKCIDRALSATAFREVEEAAWSWLALARQSLHQGIEPLVSFRFFAGVPEALSQRLTALGVDVGEGISAPNPDTAKPLQAVNLDTTTLVALVSNLSHGHVGFEFKDAALEQQAEEEAKKPMLAQLAVLLAGKELRCSPGVLASFRDTVETTAGAEESKRASRILSVVREVEAVPVDLAKQGLQEARCLDERILEVLGVGVEHSMPTLTANDTVVQALEDQASTIHVVAHMVRGLTEKKEKDEAEECSRAHSLAGGPALEKLFDAILSGPKDDAAVPVSKKQKLCEVEKAKMIAAGMELSDDDDSADDVAEAHDDAEDEEDIACNNSSMNYFNTVDAFYALHDANEADEEQLAMCTAAMEALHETCTSAFAGPEWKVPPLDFSPDVKLEQFGSVVQDTALLSSDLNVRMSFVQFEVEELGKQLKYLEGIAAAPGDNFKVVEVQKDKLPALKLMFKDKLEVFLAMGDELEDSAEVDNVIQTLLSASMDDGALRFIRLVKVFAKAHGLIDDTNGFMTSLSWVFLGAAFLQREACLPCLNLFVENAAEAVRNLWPVRLSSSLLARFFTFVEKCFEKNYTVSVATATHQATERRDSSHILFVEHPSNSSLNMAASLRPDGMKKTAEMCRKARHVLCDSGEVNVVMQIFDSDILASMRDSRRHEEQRRRDDDAARQRDDRRGEEKGDRREDKWERKDRGGGKWSDKQDDGKWSDRKDDGKWNDKKDEWRGDQAQGDKWKDRSKDASSWSQGSWSQEKSKDAGSWSQPAAAWPQANPAPAAPAAPAKVAWPGLALGKGALAAPRPAVPRPAVAPAVLQFAQAQVAAARTAVASDLRSVLAAADLQAFETAIRRLGVESASDLKYVTEDDLSAMHVSLIQRRKFQNVLANLGKSIPGIAPVVAPRPLTALRPLTPQVIPRVVHNVTGMAPKGMGKSLLGAPGPPGYGQIAAASRLVKPGAPALRPVAVQSMGQPQQWQHEDVVKAAQKRLLDNGHKKLYWEEVAKLKRDFKLSEHVELGLKLLDPQKLNMLLRGSGDLNRMLQLFPDKDKLVRSLIAKQDSYVDNLVKHLESKEAQQKGGGKGSSAMSSKGPAKGVAQAQRSTAGYGSTPYGRR